MNNLTNSIDSKSEAIKEMKSLMKKTVLKDLTWYGRATRNHGIYHRFLGIVTIALSVSLPLIASDNFETIDFLIPLTKNFLISLIGILIAFISGIRSFFRWGETFIANMQGYVELKNYVTTWELEMIEAENNPDSAEGIKKAMEATKKLILSRDFVDAKNMEDYTQFFKSLEKKD